MYVVVWVGETVAVPEDRLAWEPTPLSMLTNEAPETVQGREEDWPVVIEAGEAVNSEMTGALVAVQATAVVGVTVTEVGPVAVKETYE